MSHNKIISKDELEGLYRSGLKAPVIAGQLGVSAQSVRNWTRRYRLERYLEIRDYEWGSVWPIRPEHNGSYLLRMLRYAKRRERNQPVPPTFDDNLTFWIAERQKNDEVVCYDERRGFMLTRREAGDEELFTTRVPREAWFTPLQEARRYKD